MSTAVKVTSGIIGGAATMLTRRAARRAMHGRSGAPRLPAAGRRNGLGMMLLWATAAGLILALADVFQEQRKDSAPQD